MRERTGYKVAPLKVSAWKQGSQRGTRISFPV
jgi:hypothetical protein